jgi:hypothetical protein
MEILSEPMASSRRISSASMSSFKRFVTTTRG